jgi:formate dehydrogenase maturation protein FdhE
MSDTAAAVDVVPVVDAERVAPSAELAALVAGIVQKKPANVADAIALLEKLDLELVKWVVSDLPAAEQKLVMVGKWAASEAAAEVQAVVSSWCMPSTPKKPASAKAENA